MSDEIKVGATVNSRYELQSIIGKGRNTTVFKGYQHFAKKTIALKIIDASKSSPDELKRFQKETSLLATLHAHKNIVDVLDFGAAGIGQCFMVMHLVEGPTLRQLLDEKTKLDVPTTENIFGQIIEALAFVHEKKIVHAGLNPNEIILTPSAKGGHTATLVDFGSAVSIDEQNTPTSKPNEENYASPERVRGETLDARADIYSIGRMMYETLVGKLPELEPPSFPAELAVPERLQQAIIRATNEERDKRFASMKEFGKELQHTSSNKTGDNAEKKDLWGWTKGIFK